MLVQILCNYTIYWKWPNDTKRPSTIIITTDINLSDREIWTISYIRATIILWWSCWIHYTPLAHDFFIPVAQKTLGRAGAGGVEESVAPFPASRKGVYLASSQGEDWWSLPSLQPGGISVISLQPKARGNIGDISPAKNQGEVWGYLSSLQPGRR